jgi:hypothetical protein
LRRTQGDASVNNHNNQTLEVSDRAVTPEQSEVEGMKQAYVAMIELRRIHRSMTRDLKVVV